MNSERGIWLPINRIKIRIKTFEKVRLSVVFFLAGLYLKQFYIMPSGTFQLGDLCMMISFMCVFFEGRARINSIDRYLGVFVLFAWLINGFYSLYFDERSFTRASAYLCYNLLVIIVFRQLYQDERVLSGLAFVAKVAILTQVVICFSGLGGKYSIRDIGTFNDPNQMAFYVMTFFFFIWVSNSILDRSQKWSILWLTLALILIFKSGSAGMLIGLYIFVMTAFICPLLLPKRMRKKKRYILIIFLFVSTLAAVVVVSSVLSYKGDVYIINHLADKIKQLTSGGIQNSFYNFTLDRASSRIITVPEYFLFGAGEGQNPTIIALSNERHELHFTMIAFCYYYGIVVYCFFIYWLFKNLKHLDARVFPVYLALIIEACTLANHRQPMFWMLFVLAAHEGCKIKSSGDMSSIN